MGSTTVNRRFKFHGRIDVYEKDPAWCDNGSGSDCNHWLRLRRISAECLRRRHHRLRQWYGRRSEGGTLQGQDGRDCDALDSRDSGSVQNDKILKLVRSDVFREVMRDDAMFTLMSSEAYRDLM